VQHLAGEVDGGPQVGLAGEAVVDAEAGGEVGLLSSYSRKLGAISARGGRPASGMASSGVRE
jgi:hypothetical protein